MKKENLPFESSIIKDDRTALPAQLMAKPALAFDEFWIGLLGIPESTAEEITKSSNAPKFFLIGRRRYIRQKDALAWIDNMAESHPYFPRRNNLRQKAG